MEVFVDTLSTVTGFVESILVLVLIFLVIKLNRRVEKLEDLVIRG